MNPIEKALVKVKVTALGHIQTLIGKKSIEVPIEKSSIIGVIEGISKEYGEKVKNAIIDQRSGDLLVLILLNNRDIYFIQKNQTPVKNGDEITILPLAAGG